MPPELSEASNSHAKFEWASAFLAADRDSSLVETKIKSGMSDRTTLLRSLLRKSARERGPQLISILYRSKSAESLEIRSKTGAVQKNTASQPKAKIHFTPSKATVSLLLSLHEKMVADLQDISSHQPALISNYPVLESAQIEDLLVRAVSNAIALFAELHGRPSKVSEQFADQNGFRPAFTRYLLDDLPIFDLAASARLLEYIKKDLMDLTGNRLVTSGGAAVFQKDGALWLRWEPYALISEDVLRSGKGRTKARFE